MSETGKIRDVVLRSLSAVGAAREAEFYADLFKSQTAEQFALIVLDPRCLKNPLLEAFISNIRILTDLGLVPVMLVGALDDDRTSVRFQSERLSRELESVSVRASKLNTASYGLIPEIQSKARRGRIPILELTEQGEKYGLTSIAKRLRPAKIIFLQPSGGISRDGERVPVIDIDNPGSFVDIDELTLGQTRFLQIAQSLTAELARETVYVIASPLNLLAELFTIKGSGTLLRPAAKIQAYARLEEVGQKPLQASIEDAFDRYLKPGFWSRPARLILAEKNFRGGAIVTELEGLPYLSKFWVTREARGEGLARDIWEKLIAHEDAFFWRSRRKNPFSDWYMKMCEGMQVNQDWYVFWRGIALRDLSHAIFTASHAPEDFISRDTPAQGKLL